MKKNIIYITADQLGANFIGCYGSGVNSTPALDALAAQGIRFDRCYATHPVCAPNRSTMLTGRCDEITGIISNNLVLHDYCPTIAHVLSQAGYCTGGFGKFHQTPMQMPLPDDLSYLGFQESIITEDPKLGPWLDEIREKYPEYADAALGVSWWMPYLEEYGQNGENISEYLKEQKKKYVVSRRKYGVRFMYTSPLPKELHQTAWITDKALDFIRRHKDEPFFCNISYVDPHAPYDPPEPYDTMFDPSDMPDPIPRGWKNNPMFEDHVRHMGAQKLYGDTAKIKKLRALYHGSIRFVDDQIGRIISFLKESGLWDSTILIFTTDHGDMMMDHDLMTKGAMHYDSSTRCPLIVGGAISPAEHSSDRLTCTLDFCPTICDLLHILDRPLYEGRSFAKIADRTLPDQIISQYSADNRGHYLVEEIPEFTEKFSILPNGRHVTQTVFQTNEPWSEVTIQSNRILRSIVTDDGYRLTLYSNHMPGELFDLKNDPEELHNLYDDPAWTELKIELLERHIKAFTARTAIPRYDSLPLLHGQRWTDGGDFDNYPVFTLKKDRETLK